MKITDEKRDHIKTILDEMLTDISEYARLANGWEIKEEDDYNEFKEVMEHHVNKLYLILQGKTCLCADCCDV